MHRGFCSPGRAATKERSDAPATRYLPATLVSEEHLAFYQAVCDFAEHDIAPHLLTWERQHCLLPEKAIAAMGELGLFGLTVAEQYGGQGGGQMELVFMGLALGYHSQSVAITPGAAASLGIKPLQLCGSEAQKRHICRTWPPANACLCLACPSQGVARMRANPEVTATRLAGGWRLQGEKCWSTNAKWASHIIVHALTNRARPPGPSLDLFYCADG